MSGWTQHEGLAVSLFGENIDTDQLIPARFMSTPRAQGYGQFLLHDLRHDENGNLVEDFPLNRRPGASVLLAQRNFGSGSSREAAVYALVDFGIRAVIAPSFGDIFSSNAVNNGLLPAQISEADSERLLSAASLSELSVKIDLVHRTITATDLTFSFALDEVWQQKLINGWDDIDLTLNSNSAIGQFRSTRQRTQPWQFPTG